MRFLRVKDEMSFSEREFRSFIRRQFQKQQKESEQAVNRILLITDSMPDPERWIGNFHRRIFSELREVNINKVDLTDRPLHGLAGELPAIIRAIIPRIESPLRQMILLLDRKGPMTAILCIVLMVPMMLLVNFYKSNVASFAEYLNGLSLKYFFADLIWQVYSLYIILIATMIVAVITGVWAMVINRQSSSDPLSNRKKLKLLMNKLEEGNYRRIRRKFNARIHVGPSAVYVGPVERFFEEFDIKCLYESLFNQDAFLMKLNYFIIGISLQPGTARQAFLQGSGVSRQAVFEVQTEPNDGFPEPTPSVTKRTIQLVEAFIDECIGDTYYKEITWSFYSTFSLYAHMTRIYNGLSPTQFGREIDRHLARIDGLLKASGFNTFQSEFRNIIPHFNHHRKLIEKLVTESAKKYQYVDGSVLNYLRERLPAPNRFLINLILLHIVSKLPDKYWSALDRRPMVKKYSQRALVELESIKNMLNVELCQQVMDITDTLIDELEKNRSEDYTIWLSAIFLLCSQYAKAELNMADYFNRFHRICIFEDIESEMYNRLQAIAPDGSRLSKDLERLKAIHMDPEKVLGDLKVSPDPNPEDIFLLWLHLAAVDFLKVQPLLPLLLVDGYGLVASDSIEAPILGMGGGLNFATWVCIVQMRLLVIHPEGQDRFNEAISALMDALQVGTYDTNLRDIRSIWKFCVGLIVLVEYLHYIGIINNGSSVPEENPEVTKWINYTSERLGIRGELVPGSAFPESFFKDLEEQLGLVQFILKLRGVKMLPDIMTYYDAKFIYVTQKTGAAFRGHELPISDIYNQEADRGTFLNLERIAKKKREPIIWPGLSIQSQMLKACMDLEIIASIGLEDLYSCFNSYENRLNVDHHEVVELGSWLFQKWRLYGREESPRFKQLLVRNVRRLLETVTPSLMTVKEKIDHIDNLILLSNSCYKHKMVDEAIKLLRLARVFFDKDSTIKNEENEKFEYFYCLIGIQEIILYNEGLIGKPAISLDTILENDVFQREENYAAAISCFIKEKGNLQRIYKYLKIFAQQRLTPFISQKWFNFIVSLPDNNRLNDSSVEDKLAGDILELLIGKSGRLKLNYLPLDVLSEGILRLGSIAQEKITGNNGLFKQLADKALVYMAKVDGAAARQIFLKNMKENMQADDYKHICIMAYRQFMKYMAIDRGIRVQIDTLERKDRSDDLDTCLIDCRKCTKLIRKLMKSRDKVFKVLPLVIRLEEVCLAHSKKDDSFNEQLRDIDEFWVDLGHTITRDFTKDLAENLRIPLEVREQVIKFFEFLTGEKLTLEKKAVFMDQRQYRKAFEMITTATGDYKLSKQSKNE